jgi:hypothetical protein
MKRVMIIAGVLFVIGACATPLVMVMGVAMLGGASGGRQTAEPVACQVGTSTTAWSPAQLALARVGAAAANTLPDTPKGARQQAAVIIIATGIVEQGLVNVAEGDEDSVGWLQQRPSQGWGTIEQIMSPEFAARSFMAHLAKVRQW